MAEDVSSVESCAGWCEVTNGCQYFVFGIRGGSIGKCFWEKTVLAECQEGWLDDATYNFYELKGELQKI